MEMGRTQRGAGAGLSMEMGRTQRGAGAGLSVETGRTQRGAGAGLSMEQGQDSAWSGGRTQRIRLPVQGTQVLPLVYCGVIKPMRHNY